MVDENMDDKDLAVFFEYQLPIFDENLAEENTPLHQRPFHATMYFVKYCIVDIKNESKEDILEKPWFKFFYRQVAEWYSRRYGDAMKGISDNHAVSAVLIYGTPFRVQIPLSVNGDWATPTSRWFCWPNEVLPEENVLDWVVNPPNFGQMSSEEVSRVRADLTTVANSIRAIRVNLGTATKETEELSKLADGITSHIYKSANDILKMSAASISSSVWELHLAMEKSFKLLMRQKGVNPGNTHDLTDLLRKANALKEIFLDEGLLRELPSHHDAIRHRYGEAQDLAVGRVLANYGITLAIVRDVTAALNRDFFMENAKFLLQLPPWES